MFTIEQIKTELVKVKTGADFPAYVQELKKLGVVWYETFVSDVHSFYQGKNGHSVSSPPLFPPIEIEDTASEKTLKDAIVRHQKGETDFPTIRSQAAAAGVNKWIVNIEDLTCTYYDKAGKIILVEKIPVPVVR